MLSLSTHEINVFSLSIYFYTSDYIFLFVHMTYVLISDLIIREIFSINIIFKFLHFSQP